MENIRLSAPVWGAGKEKEKNCTLAFVCDLDGSKGEEYRLLLAAGDLYRLYLGDELRGYGPARAAHGSARVDEYRFAGTGERIRITVEVVSYQVNSYYLTLEPPFFDALLLCGERQIAGTEDFVCYHLNDRVQKVQRFSFQRPFVESYSFSEREKLYRGEPVVYPVLPVEPAEKRNYLPRNVAYPDLHEALPRAMIEQGSVTFDAALPVWKDRSLDAIGTTLLGFEHGELDEMLSDTVCRFSYEKNGTGKDRYYLYEFPFLQTGLTDLSVTVDEDCELYLIFEEILWQEEGAQAPDAAANLCFWRGECANIIKYKLKKGSYRLTSFEIYTLKYLKVVCLNGSARLERVGLVTVENPTVSFSCEVADEQVQAIMEAALHTYAQNTVDLLMDCPGRERSGWTNDSYFSSESDRMFSGCRTVERNFMENVIAAPDLEHIPAGVLPMCYPCDHFDGVFSPTCSMWFALEVCKYCKDVLNGVMPEHFAKRLRRLVGYLDQFRNGDGLLEDINSWVFIEWSRANDPDLVCGVNYPANMLYARMLTELGTMWDDANLRERGRAAAEKIREQSFNGTFFEDNRVRENGVLVPTGHVTETCQYFAFFLGIADRVEYAELFRNLVGNYRYNENKSGEKDRTRSNIIVGLILRETLLLEAGYSAQVVEECREILYKMAQRTGTLWENVDIRASCNHNIASYFAVLMTKAITGYRGVENGGIRMADSVAGIDGTFRFTRDGVPIAITVCGGRADVKSSLPVIR